VAVTRPAHPREHGPLAGVGGRVRLARYAARLSTVVSRTVRGGSGTVIGGRVLQAAAPAAVSTLAAGRHTTLVTGTNGKTSITALTVAALGSVDVGSNRDGANTGAGIAGTLATTDASRMVLETDEGWLAWAVRETRPELVVLANLSRDQLSRHHEVGALAAGWRSVLAGAPTVVANADDPAVVWAALSARAQVWVGVGSRWHDDSQVCPSCGGRCLADAYDWRCTSCQLRRPETTWRLAGDVLHGPGVRIPLRLDLPGHFNRANAALAVVAAVTGAGVAPEDAAARLGEVRSVAGRYERVHYRGHDLRLLLAKNPAGWLELLDVLGSDSRPVVLLFNADGVDGRDPSWLYDVSFASLRGRRVLVQGRRGTDLLVRLELDGVEARHVPGSLAEAVWRLPSGHEVDVVGNYTAFQRALREVRRA
jgi:UDP-N-acetylmuramyl tripeptide synthase